ARRASRGTAAPWPAGQLPATPGGKTPSRAAPRSWRAVEVSSAIAASGLHGALSQRGSGWASPRKTTPRRTRARRWLSSQAATAEPGPAGAQLPGARAVGGQREAMRSNALRPRSTRLVVHDRQPPALLLDEQVHGALDEDPEFVRSPEVQLQQERELPPDPPR